MKKKEVLQTGDTTFYQYDSEIGFWGKPNINKEVTFSSTNTHVFVEQNSEGNRDRNYQPDELENTIICFGGSHTWGVGIESNKRYTYFLNQKVEQDVLNFGHCSLGLDQICMFMLQRVLKYRPSIIVIEQYPWSITRIMNTYINGYVKPHFHIDKDDKLKLKKNHWSLNLGFVTKTIGTMHKYKKEIQEFKAGIDLKNKYDPLTDPIFLYWKISYYDYLYNLTEKILKVIRDFTSEQGINLLFALGVVKQHLMFNNPSSLVDYTLPRNRLIRLLEKQNIDYVDSSTTMIESHCETDPVAFADGHLNEKGNRIFSDVVYNKLLEKQWV